MVNIMINAIHIIAGTAGNDDDRLILNIFLRSKAFSCFVGESCLTADKSRDFNSIDVV